MRRRAGTLIGLISDTHGLVRPEALAALRGVDLILHGGDIGGRPEHRRLASMAKVLAALREIAPVVAVRGNNDREPGARSLPIRKFLKVGGVDILLIHDRKELPDPEAVDVVVSGHSHVPGTERGSGVLFVNPGSAGPRRFSLPVTCGRLAISGRRVSAEILPLV